MTMPWWTIIIWLVLGAVIGFLFAALIVMGDDEE